MTALAQRTPPTPVTLLVNARQVSASLDKEDRDVPGTYILAVQGDVPSNRLADAALDIFHSSVPVGVLDDFEFDVIHPTDWRVLETSDTATDGEFVDWGDVVSLHSRVPLQVATVRVRGAGDDEGCDLGEVTVAGESERQLEQAAIDALWDERLATAGLSPACEIVSYRDQAQTPAAGKERPRQ